MQALFRLGEIYLFKLFIHLLIYLCIYFLFHSVQYALTLYRYLKEWRKNPHWSISCCLALLLPLNDLQGEISGVVETNVLNSQLQTGEIDMPTVYGAVKDSGTIDVNLEENEQEVNSEELRNSKGKSFVYDGRKCHQGTQTELFALSFTGVVVNE